MPDLHPLDQATAQALARMTRFYRMLSRVNQLMVRVDSKGALLQGVCEAAVEAGGFQLAWVAWKEPGSPRLAHLARAGAVDYLEGLQVYWDDRPEGRGPSGTCVREGRAVVCNDFAQEPSFSPWRDRAARFRLHASISVPIRVKGEVQGCLMAYSDETGLFSEPEVQLFERTASDIGFGLDHLELQQERARTHAALLESEQALARSQALAHVGHWIWDEPTGRLHPSEELIRILGLDAATGDAGLEGMWRARVHPEDLPQVLAMQEALRRGLGHPGMECRILHPAGGLRRLRLVPGDRGVDAAGHLLRLSGVVQDVTELREAEAQLFQTQKMESLGTLASGVAHDMNNILNGILLLASHHGEAPDLPRPALEAFQGIAGACHRGRDLLKGLLAFVRKPLAQRVPLDLNDLVREYASLLKRTTHQRIAIVADLAPEGCPALGDPSALGSALMNLCVNAVDAMPQGGTLTIRTRRDGEQVELSVEDTGTGMPEEVQARALDPFFTTKPQGQGTGLGLPIVYRVVQAHGGDLALQSTPGQGTTLRLRLPAASGEAPAPAPEGPESGPAAPAPGLDLLLVDDEEVVRGVVEMVLQSLGHRATAAASGEAALALLDGGLMVDAILLDLNMPGLGGQETLVRLGERHPEIPVLLCTGRADAVAEGAVARHPRASVLAKPFTVKELGAALARVRGGRP